jgi:hypothetical protein
MFDLTFAPSTLLSFAEYIEQHVGAEERDWTIKIPSDIEKALTLARTCMKRSRELMLEDGGIPYTKGEENNWSARMGNLCNELGSFYQESVEIRIGFQSF